MKRKSQSKARPSPSKLPRVSPSPSPSEPVKVEPSLTLSASEENVRLSEQDKNLDQLLADMEKPNEAIQGGQSGDQPAASSLPQPVPAIDPEVYRQLGILGSYTIAATIKMAVKPLKKDFRPLTPDQVEKVQPSTSKIIKKLFDWAWPQLLEKHGEETIAVMAWGSVILENLKPIEEPVKEPVREPIRGVVLPDASPSVTVDQPLVQTVEVVK